MRSSTDPVATRTRRNIAILIFMIFVGTGIGASPTPVLADVSGLAYSSDVRAYDNTGGTSDVDSAYYVSWPSDLDRWTTSQLEASEGSTGEEGDGTYHVRSATSHVFDPVFENGTLSSIASASSVRIDTSVAGCPSGDRDCIASGNASAEYEFSVQVTEGTRLRLSGTVTTSQPGSSANDTWCAITIYGATVHREIECNKYDHLPEVLLVSFDEILPAGWYEFSVETGAYSNAYDFLPQGYGQVDTDLRLEVDGGEPQTVDFDWTVPDRFGNDDNGDGLIDYTAPDGPVAVAPAGGWQVDFIALDSTPCDDGVTRSWSIDGDPISTEDPRALVLDPHGCAFSYRFETEGVYEVTLEVRQADDSPLGDVTMTVTVQDWLIVSIGDSVASGEGNPDRASLDPFTPETWQDQQCHRTALAGPAQAALAIEQGDPKTSVTFIHLACSGATIASGLIGRYGGIETFADLPPQLDQILAFAGDREIDAITVSIGANDVHFSKILEKCVIQPLCHTDTPGSAARYFANRVRNLSGWFDALQAGITGREFDPARVFITQYFDPTRSDSGSICPDGTILGDAPVPGFLQISEAEANWASNDMLVRLDSEVRAAAGTHGWKFVDGIREPFLRHGYCAGDRWVVTMTESQLYQGDKNGTIHPNVAGHALYGRVIATSLLAALYTDSDLTKPRAPGPGE